MEDVIFEIAGVNALFRALQDTFPNARMSPKLKPVSCGKVRRNEIL